MEEEKLRLKKLIQHWTEHNDEHTARYAEAAEQASKLGLPRTGEALRDAAEAGRNVSKALRKSMTSVT